MAKILLVEDEPDLAKLVHDWLTAELHLVEISNNGQDALRCLEMNSYDLMILDLLLPGLDGISVCRTYRSKLGTMPILMLTAKSSLDEKEEGLDAGADDYLTKPFHLRELAARVRVLLRRPPLVIYSELSVGNVVMNLSECKVTKAGREVHLLPKEYRLLEFLLRHPRQVFSSELLFNRVWESDTSACLDTVRAHIMRLRSKLDTAGKPSIIETVPRVGYRIHSSDA